MPRFTQPSFHLVPPAWCFQLAPLKPYSQPKGNIRHRKWVKSQAMWTKPLVFSGSHVWIMVLKDSYRVAHATHVSESHSCHCIQKLILWWGIKMHLWIHLCHLAIDTSARCSQECCGGASQRVSRSTGGKEDGRVPCLLLTLGSPISSTDYYLITLSAVTAIFGTYKLFIFKKLQKQIRWKINP